MEAFNLRIKEIKCGRRQEKLELFRQGSWVVFKGAINLSDPCHTIKVEEKVDPSAKTIELFLKVYRKKMICTKCLAHISFELWLNAYHYRQKLDTKKARITVSYYFKGKTETLFDDEVDL